MLTAAQIRDLTHNLNLQNPQHCELYQLTFYQMVAELEGRWKEAYDDGTEQAIRARRARGEKEPKGKVTVGIGFNMDVSTARDQWEETFQGEVSFDKVYAGQATLTDNQMDRLLDTSLSVRKGELERLYGSNWHKLRPNERMAIEDAHFNYPGLVGPRSNFKKHMDDYVEGGDAEDLSKAVYELRERSNPKHSDGIKKRRNAEADLLDSTQTPFYVSPRTQRFIDSVLPLIQPEKTIIPWDIQKYLNPQPNMDYFVWRTQADGKVRADHAWREGLVFERTQENLDLLGLYNCRCYLEDLSVDFAIHRPHHSLHNVKTLADFFRRGGAGEITLYG